MIRRSLRARLALVLFVISFVPMGLFAVFNIGEARARILRDEAALLDARGDQLASELDAFNHGYARASSRLAKVPEVVEFLGSLPRDGAEPSRASIATRLDAQADGDPGVRGIGLADRTGRVRVATQAGLVGANLALRRPVQDGVQGAGWISDPYQSELDEPTIAYVAPVFGGDRSVLGAVVFWVRAEVMWDLVRGSNTLAGAGSFAVVFDHDGIRIAHTYSRDIVFHPGGPLSAEVMKHLVAERRFGLATSDLLHDIRSFPAQFARARAARCDPRLFEGFAPVNQQRNSGIGRRLTSVPWTVFYMVPTVTLTDPIDRVARRQLVVSLLIGIVALAVGVLFGARLIRPIRALAGAAVTIAFNSMADRLEQQANDVRRAHDDLELLVEQRTSELRAREQSLATTLDSIGDAVIVTDDAGVVTRMNPVAEALTGWTMADAVGQHLAEVFRIVNEATKETVESPVVRALREGRIVGLANHTVLLSRAGGECPIADSAAPIIDHDARIRGVVLVFRDMTSEHEAQRALVASEQKYRELYEGSPDMYLTADLITDAVTDCNQTLCDLLGYDRSELVGQSYQRVYHAESAVHTSDRFAAFQLTGEFVDAERVLRRKDGSSIEVSMNLRGLRDARGRLVGALAVYRDITRRKQGDRDRQLLLQLGETLRSSTDVVEVLVAVATQLATYVQVSRCLFCELDTDTDQVTIHRDYHAELASLAGTRVLSSFGAGTAAESARGATVVIADAATDLRTAALFEDSYRPASIRSLISVPLMRDGRWVASMSICSHEIRAWEEREIALVKLVAERVWLWIEHLTALARLRERDVAIAVQHSEDRFRTLVEGVRDYAIFMLDPHGKVATWNAGAERLKGYLAAEIIGQDAAVFSTREDQDNDHLHRMLDQARSHGRAEEEGWRVRKDGSRFWADTVITSIRDHDGALEGFAKVTRDSTDRRTHDEALRAKQAALAQSLKEREVLLQEVHHRVKNNLQVISSLINMQVRKLEHGRPRDALEECQSRVLAIALIHEKLYQSQDYARVRFTDYARSLAGSVFHMMGVSQSDVQLDLAIDEMPLGVDRAIPCGLVINELISNALKHGFPNGRTGTIRVEMKEIDDGMLRLTVRDDGVGLPEGFAVDKVESLGLQLVSTLAEQLEARLVIRSERGASFQLTFARGG